MPVRLLLVRHGETVRGAQGRYAGHSDTPLTENGRRQVLALRERMARFHPDRIYVSDLARCRETAALLYPDREHVVTARIREVDWGRWEGRTHDELVRAHAERFTRWYENPALGGPPGGETLASVRRRVRRFASDVARRYPGRTLAFVTHGGVIRLLTGPLGPGFWARRVPTATLTVARWPESPIPSFAMKSGDGFGG